MRRVILINAIVYVTSNGEVHMLRCVCAHGSNKTHRVNSSLASGLCAGWFLFCVRAIGCWLGRAAHEWVPRGCDRQHSIAIKFLLFTIFTAPFAHLLFTCITPVGEWIGGTHREALFLSPPHLHPAYSQPLCCMRQMRLFQPT
jgi:hypothetical protein